MNLGQHLSEIGGSLRKNKLRSFLTAFSVLWGIFIFIILLGSGKGLQNGIIKQFDSAALNTFWTGGRRTKLPYNGHKPGRRIELTQDDMKAVENYVKGYQHSAYRFTIPTTDIIRYKNNFGNYQLRTATPYYDILEKIDIINGRFLNENDEREKRKVTAISTIVRDAIFKGGINPIGEFISVGGVSFKVVGIFEETESYGNDKCIYIPVSTGQSAYAEQTNDHIAIMYPEGITLEESEKISENVVSLLARRKQFHPDDHRAIWSINNMKEYSKFKSMTGAINMFVGLVGVLTIIAGVVGVSNIMTIVVKERTREIGIRKAIGARPSSIISTIMLEAIFLTSIAGYLGVFFGIMVLDLASGLLPNDGFFIDPSADIRVVFMAVGFLIFAGLLAGFFPALRAAKIKPIVALREE